MRIGKFECSRVKDEDLKAYKLELVEFMQKLALEGKADYFVVSNPTDHKYMGAVWAYGNVSRVEVGDMVRKMYEVVKSLGDYDDNVDYFGIARACPEVPDLHGSHILVFQDNHIFSGEVVG